MCAVFDIKKVIYVHKGMRYRPEAMRFTEPGGMRFTKVVHFVDLDARTTVQAPFMQSFAAFSETAFQNWIDLGCPDPKNDYKLKIGFMESQLKNIRKIAEHHNVPLHDKERVALILMLTQPDHSIIY